MQILNVQYFVISHLHLISCYLWKILLTWYIIQLVLHQVFFYHTSPETFCSSPSCTLTLMLLCNSINIDSKTAQIHAVSPSLAGYFLFLVEMCLFLVFPLTFTSSVAVDVGLLATRGQWRYTDRSAEVSGLRGAETFPGSSWAQQWTELHINESWWIMKVWGEGNILILMRVCCLSFISPR